MRLFDLDEVTDPATLSKYLQEWYEAKIFEHPAEVGVFLADIILRQRKLQVTVTDIDGVIRELNDTVAALAETVKGLEQAFAKSPVGDALDRHVPSADKVRGILKPCPIEDCGGFANHDGYCSPERR